MREDVRAKVTEGVRAGVQAYFDTLDAAGTAPWTADGATGSRAVQELCALETILSHLRAALSTQEQGVEDNLDRETARFYKDMARLRATDPPRDHGFPNLEALADGRIGRGATLSEYIMLRDEAKLALRLLSAPPRDEPDGERAEGTMDEPVYPCADCGKERTKAEGGTVFTVCEECWRKAYPRTDSEGREPDGRYVPLHVYESAVSGRARFRKAFRNAKDEVRRLQGEIRRLRRTPPTEDREAWRPISTAPKDGTRVLLWLTPNRPKHHPPELCSYMSVGYWTDFNGGGWVRHYSGTATHWLPLPTPPSPEGEDDEDR